MKENPHKIYVDVECYTCGKKINFSKWAVATYGPMLFCTDFCQNIEGERNRRKAAEEMRIIDRIRLKNPDHKYGYLNPFCVSCGLLGPQYPTQQFIQDGAEYRCQSCRDTNRTGYVAPQFILAIDFLNHIQRKPHAEPLRFAGRPAKRPDQAGTDRRDSPERLPELGEAGEDQRRDSGEED